MTEESAAAASPIATARARATSALRRPHNWVQLAKFGPVGARGSPLTLGVSSVLATAAPPYTRGGACSSLVAVTNNSPGNRLWTFRGQRGHLAYQGLRFFVVSLLALGANELLLTAFVAAGLGKVVSQAIAVVLVTPINFVGNKLWSFRRR